MNLKVLSPHQELKAFVKYRPKRIEIDNFKKNLIELLDKIEIVKESPKDESEEHLKGYMKDFLRDTYYKDTNEINTKDTKDLVIHLGKSIKSNVGVIIEAKRPNSSEMISEKKLNVKAFHQLVYYFLKERFKLDGNDNNLDIKHLIITNIDDWYIFDAKDFEKYFAQDKKFVINFKDFENKSKSITSTKDFYNEIANKFIDNVNTEIPCVHFKIKDYENFARNNDPKDDNKLILLYKLLSPQHLLKLPFVNDSNSLNKDFYHELLHLIGLKEITEGSKNVIKRLPIESQNTGSLLENTIIQLDCLDKISQLKNPSHFGETYEERLFNVGLELVITWVNRILFLKLLEAQLISYHKNEEKKLHLFLSKDKLNDYDKLNSLFFQVLAKKPADRNSNVKKEFENVPYLNSSLFEPTEIEHATIFISNLSDDISIPLCHKTVLKDGNIKSKGELNALEYLFRFLDAYDFASEGKAEILEQNKTLINASVLGLIFEKINGYKDGSFYTPGFITAYMCKETIRRAVVQKFNETQPSKVENFKDLYNKIEDRTEANNIINSIKICDPAVGSGHFLVSALNEILVIKHDLKILQDRSGKLLKEYQLEVVNDELIVKDEEGELYEYNPKNKESQRIQETLFHEKQTIIENCLFGVDINPNSVKICRLRLWIELLKSAYYKNEIELETLPNIDINIKCGNSLISRFDLEADLYSVLKKSKWSIETYRLAVNSYQNAETKEVKREMEQLILTIKQSFSSEITQKDPTKKRLDKVASELYHKFTGTFLFEPETPYGKTEKQFAKQRKTEQENLEQEIKQLTTKIEDIKNSKIYQNSFEWRFEFPEVLDDDGNFVGFDVVIGNPPYGVNFSDLEKKYLTNFDVNVPDYEIYIYFTSLSQKILKYNGFLSYIFPNTFLSTKFGVKYRLKIFDETQVYQIVDLSNDNTFEDASVRTCIFSFRKNKEEYISNFFGLNNQNFTLKNNFNKDFLLNETENLLSLFYQDKNEITIIEKIKKYKSLKEYFEVSQGLIPYDKYRGHDEYTIKNRIWHSDVQKDETYKKELKGGDVDRYSLKWNGKLWISYGSWLAAPRDIKFFTRERILIREITSDKLQSTIICEEYYNTPSLINVINEKDILDLKYCLSILNSNLIGWYHNKVSPKANKGLFPKILISDVRNIPIIEISKEKQKPFIDLVDKILAIKNENPETDTAVLENEIDQLVYKLYDLSPEEIEIIKGNVK